MAEYKSAEFITATMTQGELGKVLGLTQARISQLLDEGILVRDEESRRPLLFESLRNYYLSKNATGEGVNFWKERGLHEKAKRELAELKLAKSRGEVYDATTVESVLVELLTNFRSKLTGLPAKYSTQLEGKTRGEIYDMLTTAIEEELTELSEGVAAVEFDEDSESATEDTTERSEAD